MTRQIGAEYGISHKAVNNRATADGWTRDLTKKIQAKAEDKLSKAALSKELSTATVATEQQVVEANAEVQFRIRLEHRKDIGRTRALFRSMFEVASFTEGHPRWQFREALKRFSGVDEEEEQPGLNENDLHPFECRPSSHLKSCW